ncbi:MAG TPA: radical SAM protein [Victivallales bacterium]|nr:radical SAM protein [Victivallales bacterium]
MQYREPLFRPPAEADSLIFQVAFGCPHNTCRFCLMYKGVKYSARVLDELLKEIESAGRIYPDARRIFLADGDVMALPFPSLLAIFAKLNECFPELSRINSYANGSSILKLSKKELTELHRLKLNTLYIGLESGDQKLLDEVCKNEKVDDMIDGVKTVQDIGIKASVMILLGLAGKNASEEHAIKTAEALNKMQPRLLSALRFVEFPGKTKMHEGYLASTEYEIVCELRKIIQNLDLKKTVFRANHSSNPLPLGGRFPQDKETLLAQLQNMLESNFLDKKGPGSTPLWL